MLHTSNSVCQMVSMSAELL